MDQSREQRIRDRAYVIWTREGCPEGREDWHWRLACEDIEREDAPPAWWFGPRHTAPRGRRS